MPINNEIDDLEASISKHGGLAPSNRFNIIFTPPTVSLINLNPTNIIGNLINNSFSWRDLINDPRDISLLCKTATLPSRNINTAVHTEHREEQKFVTGKQDGDITTVFYITNDMYIKTMFDGWMDHIFDSDGYRANYKDDFTTDVTIQQVNRRGHPVYGVRSIKAFPTQMGELTLDNTADNGIHELSIGWSYERYVPENALTSSIGSGLRTIGNLLS